MVKYSEDLWDGFEILNTKSEHGVQVVKDVAEFLKKRAQLEADYAKGLAALCKTAPGSAGGLFSKGPAVVEKETKTLKAAILAIQEEGSRAATVHQDFANKVLNDVVKPLETFLKTKENDRKKTATEGQKRLKSLADAKAGAEKAKDSYQKATKESEAATEAHTKASADLAAASDNKKLQEAEKRASSKAGPLAEKAKAAEAAYTKAVDTANDLITKTYGEHIPPLLESLQQFEEDRYAQIRDVLQEYLNAQKTIPTNLDERCQEIEKNVSAISIDSDLTEFADAHKSATSEPEKIVLVTKDSPAVSAPVAATTTTTETSTTTTTTSESAKPTKNEEDIF